MLDDGIRHSRLFDFFVVRSLRVRSKKIGETDGRNEGNLKYVLGTAP